MTAVRAARVGYVVSRFPKTTETFIVREAEAIRAAGTPVTMFAINRQHDQVHQPGAESFLGDLTAISDFGAASLIAANWRAAGSHLRPWLRMWTRGLVGNIRSPKFFGRALVTSAGAPGIAEAVSASGITHLHAHWGTHSALLAYQVHLLTGIPFSVMLHAHDLHVDQTMLSEKLRAAAAVCTISEHNRELIVKAFPEVASKTHLIRCGVDTDLVRPRSAMAPNRPPRVVVVAGLRDFKGHRYLLEAQRVLASGQRPIAIDLVGDGPLRAELELDAATTDAEVVFHGALPFDAGRAILEKASVAVMPSVVLEDGRRDGIPVALIEAMACGVPVIGTRVSGVPELVRHEETGLLVEPRDPAALADAIVATVDHPIATKRRATAARALVESDFDICQVARRLVDIIVKPDPAIDLRFRQSWSQQTMIEP